MVDYDLKDPEILEALRKIKSINVKTTIECGFDPWTPDEKLVEGTTTERRLLLTANYNDINEDVYEPCYHGGIILIKHERPSPETVANRLKAFAQCGKRSLAKSHVTHLNENSATIHTLDEKPVEVRFK
jgi:hypothetical protein